MGIGPKCRKSAGPACRTEWTMLKTLAVANYRSIRSLVMPLELA
jgi:hypothetical protein